MSSHLWIGMEMDVWSTVANASRSVSCQKKTIHQEHGCLIRILSAFQVDCHVYNFQEEKKMAKKQQQRNHQPKARKYKKRIAGQNFGKSHIIPFWDN